MKYSKKSLSADEQKLAQNRFLLKMREIKSDIGCVVYHTPEEARQILSQVWVKLNELETMVLNDNYSDVEAKGKESNSEVVFFSTASKVVIREERKSLPLFGAYRQDRRTS